MFRDRVYCPGSGCYASPKSWSRSRDLSGAVSDFDGSSSRRNTISFHAVDVPVANLFYHKFVFSLFSWASLRGCRSVGASSTFSPFLHCTVFLTWYVFLLLLDSSLHFWKLHSHWYFESQMWRNCDNFLAVSTAFVHFMMFIIVHQWTTQQTHYLLLQIMQTIEVQSHIKIHTCTYILCLNSIIEAIRRRLSAEGAKPESNNRWKSDLGHVCGWEDR